MRGKPFSRLRLVLSWAADCSNNTAHLSSAVGKAVSNHAQVRGLIPSTDVGKEADRAIFVPVSDASV